MMRDSVDLNLLKGFSATTAPSVDFAGGLAAALTCASGLDLRQRLQIGERPQDQVDAGPQFRRVEKSLHCDLEIGRAS